MSNILGARNTSVDSSVPSILHMRLSTCGLGSHSRQSIYAFSLFNSYFYLSLYCENEMKKNKVNVLKYLRLLVQMLCCVNQEQELRYKDGPAY